MQVVRLRGWHKMATIPEYSKGVIKQRQVAQTADPNAIQDAGATAFGVAKLADVGYELAQKHKEANDTTWMNAAVIENKRKKIELEAQYKEQRKSNPFGFAKEFDKEMAKIDDEYIKAAPSKEAALVFKDTTAKMNLSQYESNLLWENSAKVSLYADRVDKSVDNMKMLAFRAGKEGRPIDDILKDVDATTVSLSTLQPDKAQLSESNQKMKRDVVYNYMSAFASADPEAAKAELDSKKYDTVLGADKLENLYKISETNDPVQAEIVRQMYDMNELADMSPTDYLSGIKGIEDSIKDKLMKGEITPKTSSSLKNQLKTLTGKKVAESTNMLGYQYPEASTVFDTQLPSQYRGEAMREVFYDLSQSPNKDQKQAALDAVDKIKKTKRDAAIKAMSQVKLKTVFLTEEEASKYFADKDVPDSGILVTIGGQQGNYTK
jgi:hypothetical protein